MPHLQTWKRYLGSEVQAPLSGNGDYVISHRPGLHVVSFRPPREHHNVGNFPTARLAREAARLHHAAGAPRNPPYHYARNEDATAVVVHPGSAFACRECERIKRL